MHGCSQYCQYVQAGFPQHAASQSSADDTKIIVAPLQMVPGGRGENADSLQVGS